MQNLLVKVGGVAAVIHGLILPILVILLITQKWQPEKPIDGMMLFTNLLFSGGLVPLIVIASFFHLSQPRSRVEYLGCFLAFTAPFVFTVANQLLIQNPSLIPAAWINWAISINQFGLSIGLATMGFARLPKTGVNHLPFISKVLIGTSIVLFVTGTIWQVATSNGRVSNSMEALGVTVFLIERFIWLPLAWVMLKNQKPSLPSRAQPA
jgi:hypothetical protein